VVDLALSYQGKFRGFIHFIFFYNSFSGSKWFMPYFSTYVSLSPLLLGYRSLRASDLCWAERLGGRYLLSFNVYK
jgi:hypothetical protein